MELPSIPEQIAEADRLCGEARRLVEELRALSAAAEKRWGVMKRRNAARWGTPLDFARQGRPIRRAVTIR